MSVQRIGWPVAYITAIVLANYVTERFGIVPVGFGLVTTAGTYAAAVVLVARNLSQDAVGRGLVIVLMAVGVALSWFLASPALAVASGVAFAVSEATDMAVYTPLRHRGRSRAVAAASLVGSIPDTFLFLAIAGFPLTAAPGQLIVKVGMGLVAAGILRAAASRTTSLVAA